MNKADKFYIVTMMFIVGMWLVNSIFSSILMLILAFFWLGLWLIETSREDKLNFLNNRFKNKKEIAILETLLSINQRLKKLEGKRKRK